MYARRTAQRGLGFLSMFRLRQPPGYDVKMTPDESQVARFGKLFTAREMPPIGTPTLNVISPPQIFFNPELANTMMLVDPVAPPVVRSLLLGRGTAFRGTMIEEALGSAHFPTLGLGSVPLNLARLLQREKIKTLEELQALPSLTSDHVKGGTWSGENLKTLISMSFDPMVAWPFAAFRGAQSAFNRGIVYAMNVADHPYAETVRYDLLEDAPSIGEMDYSAPPFAYQQECLMPYNPAQLLKSVTVFTPGSDESFLSSSNAFLNPMYLPLKNYLQTPAGMTAYNQFQREESALVVQRATLWAEFVALNTETSTDKTRSDLFGELQKTALTQQRLLQRLVDAMTIASAPLDATVRTTILEAQSPAMQQQFWRMLAAGLPSYDCAIDSASTTSKTVAVRFEQDSSVFLMPTTDGAPHRMTVPDSQLLKMLAPYMGSDPSLTAADIKAKPEHAAARQYFNTLTIHDALCYLPSQLALLPLEMTTPATSASPPKPGAGGPR